MVFWLSLLLILVALVSMACVPVGQVFDSAYGPSYRYDSVHKVSCYGSAETPFCFQGLPNAEQPAKWADW